LSEKKAGYAFVILTPDDIGCHEAEIRKSEAELKTRVGAQGYIEVFSKRFKRRARQNVIFEMGYFWGLLKRKKVCCLLKGKVEKPSDIEGIVYIPFKDKIEGARFKIMKELKAVGYEIKM